MILTNSGVLKLMQRIKSFITSQLNTKAASVHTHSISEIDNLASQLGDGYSKSEVDTLLNGKADTSHTHTKSQITDFPSYGTTANTICEGNDSRLSDARTPTSHTHTKSEITDFPSLATVATSGSYNDLSNKPSIPSKTSDLTNDSNFIDSNNLKTINNNSLVGTGNITIIANSVDWDNVNNKPSTFTPSTHTHSASDITSGTLNTDRIPNLDASKITSGTIDIARLPAGALESLSTNSIPFHNAYPRCKYLGTTITDAQNTAIKNRTYDDLFIGDYWTINGVNWRIVAIDYYYNVGDTNFDKGNIIVMPDTVLYNAQMNGTDTTAGAYAGSLMRTRNLNDARTIAQNAFGSHLANHRILLANAVDSSGPSDWSWYDSDGVELPNEVQIYGTRAWGSALKGFDVATQKQQFPLMLFAPQFVNTRQTYWLQDVSSVSVSSAFAHVSDGGFAVTSGASSSYGVRPSVTLSYI